jgi:hypothetical protein
MSGVAWQWLRPDTRIAISRQTTFEQVIRRPDGRPDFVAWVEKRYPTNSEDSREPNLGDDGCELWSWVRMALKLSSEDLAALERRLAIPERCCVDATDALPANPLEVVTDRLHELIFADTQHELRLMKELRRLDKLFSVEIATLLSCRSWSSDECPRFAQYLERKGPELDAFVKAANSRCDSFLHAGFGLSFPSVSGVVWELPAAPALMGYARERRRELSHRAMMHAGNGDYESAWADLQALRTSLENYIAHNGFDPPAVAECLNYNGVFLGFAEALPNTPRWREVINRENPFRGYPWSNSAKSPLLHWARIQSVIQWASSKTRQDSRNLVPGSEAKRPFRGCTSLQAVLLRGSLDANLALRELNKLADEVERELNRSADTLFSSQSPVARAKSEAKERLASSRSELIGLFSPGRRSRLYADFLMVALADTFAVPINTRKNYIRHEQLNRWAFNLLCFRLQQGRLPATLDDLRASSSTLQSIDLQFLDRLAYQQEGNAYTLRYHLFSEPSNPLIRRWPVPKTLRQLLPLVNQRIRAVNSMLPAGERFTAWPTAADLERR